MDMISHYQYVYIYIYRYKICIRGSKCKSPQLSVAESYPTYIVNIRNNIHNTLHFHELTSSVCVYINLYNTCIRGSKCKSPHLSVAGSYSTYIVYIRKQYTLHISFPSSHIISMCIHSTGIRGSKCKSPHLSVAVSYSTYIVFK